MWCFVRQFQTLIVGAFGFIGVMATLAFNAWLARRQHDRTVSHERTSVRVALRAELEAIAESYRDRITMLGEPEQRHSGATLTLDTMTAVYRSAISRLGLLSAAEIRLVLKAYLLVEQLPDRIKLLADSTFVTDPGYVYIPVLNFATAAQMHRNYLGDIELAIAALSGGGRSS
jgi:hypothetical protein